MAIDPAEIRIYRICHLDRLASIVADGSMFSDAELAKRPAEGTQIGMSKLKRRRLEALSLRSHPELRVGQCVPFYFCPRSVMLFLLHKGNHPDLEYRGGQRPIVHLVANLRRVVEWAEQHSLRWAFTLSNAASFYFEDRADLTQLHEIDWRAVSANRWSDCIEAKQAEFLVEQRVPWALVDHIGVHDAQIGTQVSSAIAVASHKPSIAIERSWYY